MWLYQRVMFGEVTHMENKGLADVNLRELVTLVPLVLWCFWIGIYPKPYFEVMEKPVALIVERVERAGSTQPMTSVEVAVTPAERPEAKQP